jgi:hypothetical protein
MTIICIQAVPASGEVVEVRSAAEILRRWTVTPPSRGMPFMEHFVNVSLLRY